jgi:hypothetical protein
MSMLKRAAVSIGVDRPGELPPLSAAASGAKDFTAWARDQNMDVAEFTDTNGSTVTAADIKKAVLQFVNGAYSQILLYFAGHGMLLGPENEVWWLSGAPGDTAEAVNLVESTIFARGSGIAHVVWISDACRSLPSSLRLSGVRGVSIFPNPDSEDRDADVDFLYASRPGESALEAKTQEAGSSYRGLFTSCLLEGLWGKVPEVVEVMQGTPTVPSWTLKPYLKKAVPRAAARIQINLRQIPDIRAESHVPMYLALLKQTSADSFRGTVPSTPASSTLASLAALYGLDEFFRVRAAETVVERLDQPGAEFQSGVERILNTMGRSSFETRTGFSIIGQRVKTVSLDKGEFDLFEEGIAHQIAVKPQGGGSALIEFQDGTGTCLAVLPGFIGTVLVEKGLVVNVSYTPSRGTPLYADYRDNAEELNKRRAFAAVAARNGYLHLDKRNAAPFADYIRQMKYVDPALGLYAVYAYEQAGLFREVKSVFDFMISAPDPCVPFDVALLARQLPVARAVPVCPMITQGWSLLGPFLKQPPGALQEAARFLIPSLWSTFSNDGVGILRAAIEGGELK